MALPQLIFRTGARLYDWMTADEAWLSHNAALLAFAPQREEPRRIVDLGCGPGLSTLAIASAAGERDEVVGVDLSPQMLRLAMRKDAGNRCAWLQGDVHRLPLRDASVDVVIGHSFLYLLAVREDALEEIRRVLVPGGALLLLEPSRQGVAEAARSVAATLRARGPRLAFTMACWRVAAVASGAFREGELADALGAAGFAQALQVPTLNGLGWIGAARRP